MTFCGEEDIARLLAYIHNNPVRAGVVSDPFDSTWSSHRVYVGEAPAPAWLDVELGLSRAGFSSTGNGRANFHDFVRSRSGLPRDPIMTGEEVTPTTSALRAALGTSVETAPVIEANRQSVELFVRPGARVRPRTRVDPDLLLHAVSACTHVPVNEICGSSRKREFVRARRLVLIVWDRLLACPIAEVAPMLNITTQACGRLLARDDAVSALLELAVQVAQQVIEVSNVPGGLLQHQFSQHHRSQPR